MVHNSAFIFNDWVGQGEDTATVLNKHTDYGEFSHNTLYYNGIAPGLRYTGRKANITHNHMEGQCWGFIQNDGASIQECNSIDIPYPNHVWSFETCQNLYSSFPVLQTCP